MKIFVLVTKVLPMLLALCHFIDSILSCYCIDCTFVSYIGCISILTIAYLYVVSYALRLCECYRMFLHYCVVIDTVNLYDYYIGIPIDDHDVLYIYVLLTLLLLLIITYIKLFKCED